MSLSPQQKQVLDFVAERFQGQEFRVAGQLLRARMTGSSSDKERVLAALMPEYLVRQGKPPGDKYRLTLHGALCSRYAHVFRQHVGQLLVVLQGLAKRDPVFESFTIDDITKGSGLTAAAFRDGDSGWLGQVIRLAGLCDKPDEAPDGGPWHVPSDIERVGEAKGIDEFLALRGVGVSGNFEKDIDQALLLPPVPNDPESLAEVCAKLKDCIHRYAEPGSVYRLLSDGPVNRDKIKDREDGRLRDILAALREELLDDRPVGSGKDAETEWLARAAKLGGGRGRSQAALLSIIERGYTLGRQARVLVVVVRQSSSEKWHGVFGRIDLVHESDPPQTDIRPEGNVRVIDERPGKDELLSSLAAAMRGQPLVVGDVALDNHGLEDSWHSYHDFENGLRYGTVWPNVVLMAGNFTNSPFVSGPLRAEGPTRVFATFHDLARAVSGFPGRSGGDDRLRRMHVFLWDYRGRIDQFQAKGRKLFVGVFPPADEDLSVFGLITGVDGESMPFEKQAPGAEIIRFDDDIAHAHVKLEHSGDTVVAHDLHVALGDQTPEGGWNFNQFGPAPEDPEVEDAAPANGQGDTALRGEVTTVAEPAGSGEPAIAVPATPHRDPDVETRLEALSPDFAACYRQALNDLADEARESYVGVVAEMREVLSAVLHELAPDERVTSQPWFKQDPNTRGPTRAQRVKYIMSSSSASKASVADEALEALDTRLPHLAKELYGRASRGTHLAPTDRRELLTLLGYWQGLLRDLLLR